MNTYAIAELILNLVSIGLKHEELTARLQAAQASGVPDSEVPALLVKWRDEAIAAAGAAQPEPQS